MFKGVFGPSTPGDKALDLEKKKDAANKKDDDKYSGGGFDPRGLERAAKAAKQLDGSPHSKLAYEAIKQQELTKQAEFKCREAAYGMQAAQTAMSRVEAEGAEARRTLGAQTEAKNEQAQHADQLARRRFADEAHAARQRQAAEIKLQEEAELRKEKQRRKALKYEAELREKTETAKAKAKAEGEMRQERANHDLRLAKAREEAKEYRKTVIESIVVASETVGAGLKSFLSDKERMAAGVSILSLTALGIYGARAGTGVVGRYVESRLGKPSLVRETSRVSPLKAPFKAARRALSNDKAEDALAGVVLRPRLEERLRRIAVSTRNTKANNAPFRHLLLYGPPGTGKTMFARGLAQHSGLEYAVLTGGDVAPLGRDGVTEMHKLFDWAKASSKGLLLFIDEADAFLRRRATETISEDLRNALNAFLYRTGSPTSQFMLVYASNQPEQFDVAINDRIDEMVEFALPTAPERSRMLRQYVDKYLKAPPPAGRRAIVLDGGVDDALLDLVVDATEGFSGREVAKLTIAWQAAAFGAQDATLTPELAMAALEAHAAQKQIKQTWYDDAMTGAAGVVGRGAGPKS